MQPPRSVVKAPTQVQGSSEGGKRVTERVEEGRAEQASKLETPENGHAKRLCAIELLTYTTYNCVFLL